MPKKYQYYQLYSKFKKNLITVSLGKKNNIFSSYKYKILHCSHVERGLNFVNPKKVTLHCIVFSTIKVSGKYKIWVQNASKNFILKTIIKNI